MKKLIYAVIIVALATTSVYAQKQISENSMRIEKTYNEVPIVNNYFYNNRNNLISAEMQKEPIWFSDEVCMRSAKISEIQIKKNGLNQSSLIIKIEFEKVQTINRGNVEEKNSDFEKSRYITIRDISVKSYGSIYGFKLMNTTSCYDEEVYINIENKEMEKWFKTLLEGFSGKKLNQRFDPKE